ncbi:MAG: SDR family oxidoreductase [Hyphomonadaceae bacterium]
MQLIALGCGYVATALAKRLLAAGWSATGTTRSGGRADMLREQGIAPVIWPGTTPDLQAGAAWLVSTPPDAEGCPAFRAFGEQAKTAAWIGYLSTTGVYGDLGGGWAFEETPVNPMSPEARNRATAEAQWLSTGAQVFRLPGIYGPGRSALERVRAAGARRIVKPGQVFSRAHRDDIAAALARSIARPTPGAIYNVCDDEPCGADTVLAYAAELLGLSPPPAVAFEDAGLSDAAKRFYAECKRVSNAKAKAALGWLPVYPSYREGLMACLTCETDQPAST